MNSVSSPLRDIAEMRHFARNAGWDDEIAPLHQQKAVYSVGAALVDWAWIAGATAACVEFGWIAVVPALLVIGNRQRALGNLLHDASHYSFDANRRRAAVVANLVLCWPSCVSMAVYRKLHNDHHKYLGDPQKDPDYIHDARELPNGWLAVWRRQVFSPPTLRGAVLGHLGRMPLSDLAGTVAWWSCVLSTIFVVADLSTSAVFVALWVAAKVIVFHPLTAFREISDHVGLLPGTLIGFSRNHTVPGLMEQLIHPHHNGYHLSHHLLPNVPFHALPRAHALLLRWPFYARAEHCDAYFSGDRSAVDSWVQYWSRDASEPCTFRREVPR